MKPVTSLLLLSHSVAVLEQINKLEIYFLLSERLSGPVGCVCKISSMTTKSNIYFGLVEIKAKSNVAASLII